ncbi:MFS transporter [Persicobacter sp. CCB-QB2]|uniref:MFS transporter n=1 Tax=Persicobacter sp. CCB-QB2 TaxID=1561025 RepID=UPI0006A94867|nr:MFS transporter [Persicobacter sp. CCB-QB2]
MPTVSLLQNRRYNTLFLLILAGEVIFFLPFVIARLFRPTLLEVFQIDNIQLGSFFSIYGILAVFSYFFGGPLADKYPAKNLISIALVATGIGGLLMAQIPPLWVMNLLYAYWGITTIFLFWAPLIRATREWGGHDQQGHAFGILDGGRAFVAASMGTVAISLLNFVASGSVDSTAISSKAFSNLLYVVSAITMGTGLLCWIKLPKTEAGAEKPESIKPELIGKIARMKKVRYLALIIICAYIGYKTTDDFSLYAHEILGFDEIDAAKVGTISLWTRVIIAVMAGILADTFNPQKIIHYGFLLMLGSSLIIGSGLLPEGALFLPLLNLVICSIGVYTLRSLYFTLIEEGQIPILYTGTVVGLISVIGYTPDIFMGPLMGYFLEKFDSPLNHQFVFLFLSLASIIGWWASWKYEKLNSKNEK